VNRELIIRQLELEIHGLETELGVLIPEHARLARRIEALEGEKQQLRYELMRHKAVLRAERRSK
jgi:hypothetical protein